MLREKLTLQELSVIRNFSKIMDELTVHDHLILRQQRLVLPKSLQEKAVEIAHEGHLGITKTKALMRTKVWFPGMDSLVERFIGKCLACQLNSKGMVEPVKSSALPTEPWDELSIDFYGPLPNGCELVD